MQGRRVVELTVGMGLLLGPLVYALSLDVDHVDDANECIETSNPDVPIAVAEQPIADREFECHGEPEPELEPETPKPPRPAPPPGGELLLVTDAGLILTTEAEHRWGTGPLFTPPGTISYRAAKQADPAKVPAALWALRDRTYDIYGPDGKVCTARLGEPRVLAQYDGWGLSGVVSSWEGEDPETLSKSKIRRGVWAHADAWLVAPLESSDSCEGGLWARDAELSPPTILRRESAPTPITKARLAAFAESDEFAEARDRYRSGYATLAQDYPEALEYTPSWDTVLTEHGARAWSWIGPDSQPRFVALEFGFLEGGCGDFLDEWITHIGELEGDRVVEREFGHDPTAIFDVDGDGQWERLYFDRYDNAVSIESATHRRSLSVDQDFECPC